MVGDELEAQVGEQGREVGRGKGMEFGVAAGEVAAERGQGRVVDAGVAHELEGGGIGVGGAGGGEDAEEAFDGEIAVEVVEDRAVDAGDAAGAEMVNHGGGDGARGEAVLGSDAAEDFEDIGAAVDVVVRVDVRGADAEGE